MDIFLSFIDLYDLSFFISHHINLQIVKLDNKIILPMVFLFLFLAFVFYMCFILFWGKPGSQIEVLDLQPWAAIVNFVTKTENK